MGLLTRLFKNASYLTLGNQVGNLMQFLLFLYFARQFGERAVGLYSFAFSLTYICFFVVADLGASVYLVREVSRDPSGDRREILARCLSLRLLAIAIVSVLMLIIALAFFHESTGGAVQIIILLGFSQIFSGLADIFLAEFKGHDRMGLVALLSIFNKMMIAGVGISLIFLRLDFLAVLACFPIGSFIYLAFSVYYSFYDYGGIKPRLRGLAWKSLIRDLLPFGLVMVFVEVLYHLDVLMLGILKGDRSVGLYSAANRVVLTFQGVGPFIHLAVLPTFSRLYMDNPARLREVAGRTLRYLVLISLPVAAGLFAISDKLVVFLYSQAFRESITAMRILSWTIAFGFVATTYSILLTAVNRQKEKMVGIGLCLISNLAANLILIPRFGHQGAAGAKLITEALHLLVMSYLVLRYMTGLSLYKTIVKPVLSCLVMLAFIRYFQGWNMVFLVPAAGLVYLGTFGVMGGYLREEIELAKRFVLWPGQAKKTS